MLLALGVWVEVKDGDRDAFLLMSRHYSFRPYRDGRRQRRGNPNRFLFMGPGEKMVLLTPAGDALLSWRRFKNDAGEKGVMCAAFRNEGRQLSSDLIRAAVDLALARWPGERLYTYVDPSKIRSSNPGFCFIQAGWRRLTRRTKKRGLVILEKV
jgi:hypothetical protein